MAIFRKCKNVDEFNVQYQNMLVKFSGDINRVGKNGSRVVLNYDGHKLRYIIDGEKERITNSIPNVSNEMILRLLKELVAYRLCEKFELRFNL